MRTLRRFLLASLLVLTGLVVGCQQKAPSGGSVVPTPSKSTPPDPKLSESMNKKIKKIKKMQDLPEGPKLQPVK